MDIDKIRQDFAILGEVINDEPLVYLDNAATTQKPSQVLARLEAYYRQENANVHRGVHTLAERSTASYEGARETVRRFINAESRDEVLFTRGTTTGLNWVSHFAHSQLQAGDEILLTIMEHHSNIVPWQEVANKTGAKLVYVGLTSDGSLDMVDFRAKLSNKTRFVTVTHASNVLGAVNPIESIIAESHAQGALVVIDAAQSAPHIKLDVQALDVDFLAFSGHKMLGPTGIGVLYGKRSLLEKMHPVEFGGEMIDFVYEDQSTYKGLPWKFEAGTPNIAGAIGLAAAIDYLETVGLSAIHEHIQTLVAYTLPKLLAIPGIQVYGPKDASLKTGVIAFNLEGLHPHDLATALDMEGVAVRAGHHCAQPLLRYLDVAATARASFYLYNTQGECDKLIESIYKAKAFFGV